MRAAVIAAALVAAQVAGADYAPDKVIVGASSVAAVQALPGCGPVESLAPDTYLAHVAPGASVESVVGTWDSDPTVDYAELDWVQTGPTPGGGAPLGPWGWPLNAPLATPNDPSFGQLYGLQKINAEPAWDLETGDGSIVVLVIDTGLNYGHPDLADNVWVNPGEIPGNGIDDDGNGYVDDVHGINAITGTGDPDDDHFHGSHVAGTIGAVGNNALGVVGVNWHVQLAGCKFLNSGGSGQTSDAVKCFDYARRLRQDGVNVRITNNSWGGGGFSQALLDAIVASGDAGVLHFMAAGNDASNNDTTPRYPTNYATDHIVSVASTDEVDGRSSFSNWGRNEVEFGAPGSRILSTSLGSEYRTVSGTSMATPHAAGAAALLMAHRPLLSNAQVKGTLMDTVRPVSSMASTTISGGIVDINAALGGEPPPPPPPCLTPDHDGDGVCDQEDNCAAVANPVALGASTQMDTDGDGFGNACDGDFNNGSVTIPVDFTLHFLRDFGGGDDFGEGTDMDGDGLVLPPDFTTYFLPQFRQGYPGPSRCSPVPVIDPGTGGQIGWRCP